MIWYATAHCYALILSSVRLVGSIVTTDYLEPYRRLARSIRFVPPQWPKERSYGTLTEPATLKPLPAASSQTPAGTAMAEEPVGPPVDPFVHVDALIQGAVTQQTVLPVVYQIPENPGDRIARLSQAAPAPAEAVVSMPKFPNPDDYREIDPAAIAPPAAPAPEPEAKTPEAPAAVPEPEVASKPAAVEEPIAPEPVAEAPVAEEAVVIEEPAAEAPAAAIAPEPEPVAEPAAEAPVAEESAPEPVATAEAPAEAAAIAPEAPSEPVAETAPEPIAEAPAEAAPEPVADATEPAPSTTRTSRSTKASRTKTQSKAESNGTDKRSSQGFGASSSRRSSKRKSR